MYFQETTLAPFPRFRDIPRLETEVSNLYMVYTHPFEAVSVWNTRIPNSYVSDRLYSKELPIQRTDNPDMVMVGPSLNVGGLFPLRLDTNRLGEIYNELTRDTALLVSGKGLFFVDGKDREQKDLRFENAHFSLFEDKDGIVRHQENGKEPVYQYDEWRDKLTYTRFLKTVPYKGDERNVFVSIEFDSTFFDGSKKYNELLDGTYDPKKLRSALSYSFTLL
jgi:hypothetical protein